jgi:hypothetical protein
MKTLIVLAVITGLLLWYALWGREWLKAKPWGWSVAFFAWIEPIEIFLFRKSETILFARMKMACGVVLTYLAQASQIDWTPILPFIPEKYRGMVNALISSLPLLLSLLGAADEKQRLTTTKPIQLVAVPDKVVAETPRLAEAVAMADATKVEAVAAVAEAKAA